MLSIGLVWIYFYVKLPNWDGVGAFEVNAAYILSKLKVFFILNFNWLLLLISIGMILVEWKDKKFLLDILPIIISDVAFTLFSCLFNTVNHGRYIDTHIVVLNLLAILGIGLIKSRKVNLMMTTMLFIIMLFSNYRTIDPFTIMAFNNYNVGSCVMISTSSEILSDSMVYNQQYRYFDKALDEALREPIYEENTLIFFPLINGREWFFEGLGTEADLGLIGPLYWNEDKEKRVRTPEPNTISFEHCYITEESDINEILNGRIGYYFYVPFAGEEIGRTIRDNMEVLEEQKFSYMGFDVIRIKFI